MPLVSRTFDQLISFTRTSAATYVNSAGNIVSTPASKNLLTFTEEFDNAAWAKSNATITANSTAAPDGTMTADTLVEDAATATHLMSQTQTLSATPYTASVYLKAKERGFALFSQGTVNGISVDLSTGVVASAVGSPTNIASTNAGNGWWRVSFTFTPSAGSTPLNVYASTDGVWANRSYAGSTSSGIFVWGTQLELGSTLTSYVRNFGGLFPPRFDYDPVTLQPRGLLIEEQRTNLLLNSLINGTSLSTQSVSVSAVAHTLSFYGSGSVVLSDAHSATLNGSGAYPARTTLTFTPSAGTLTLTVTGTVQFAQLEAASFATSYIPTGASQVTRTADQASIVAPNFAPWYNQSEGTFVVEFDTSISGALPVTAYMIALDASGSKRIAYIGSGSELASTFDGSTILSAAGDVTGPVSKTAMAYSPTERAISSNGQAATTGAVAAGFSSASSLNIGSAGSVGQLNGHIRRIAYYPARLSNAQLQALSA